nr:M20/M25/M40 family metallo-hydrolase [Candidatus Sigynarchaeota archaeon]
MWGDEQELAILRESIQAYAPSFQEKPVIGIIKKIFDGLPVEFSTDTFGNVKVVAGHGKPVLFLASHMDTIASPLPFKEDVEFMHGRGAVDCRPSLMAMALATRRAVMNGFKGTVVFGGIAAEEVSTDGIKIFLESMKEKPDFAIFGEPTGSGRVCIAYKGRVWLAIAVKSKPGHVAAAWIHANPIEVITDFYDAMKAGLDSLVKKKELSPFFTPRATITTLNAGSIPNMIPGEATADIDIRFPPSIPKEKIIGMATSVKENLLTKYREQDPAIAIGIEVKSSIDGIKVEQDNLVCQALGACIEESTKEKVSFVKKTGTTFMNHIGTFFKCPIVTYGPGDPGLEHTSDEHVSKKEFLAAIKILEAVIVKLSG